MTLRCQACRRQMAPGEALRVTPTDGRPAYAVHRYGISPACFSRSVGPRRRFTVALYDREAADIVDRTDLAPIHEPTARAREAARGDLLAAGSTPAVGTSPGGVDG